jgi:hypothetical protein
MALAEQAEAFNIHATVSQVLGHFRRWHLRIGSRKQINREERRGAMLRFHPSRFGWILALTLGFWAVVVQAQEFHYRYVSLDQLELPSGFTFFSPAAIHNSGRVYGTVRDDSFSDFHIAFYKDGTLTVLQSSGLASTVNAGGTVGGRVLVDPQNFIFQAALFRGDEVELIPPQPGEVRGIVIALNDRGTALVESDDASGQPTYVLYSTGQTTPLDFGPTVTNPRFMRRVGTDRFINNEGILAGTEGSDFFGDGRGFRFNPRTGEVTLLEPVPPDTLSWGLGINNRGDVLGYSFVNAGPYHERIGVWDRNGDFKTYFDETFSSDVLVFNDNNLIVITLVSRTHTSYLVPKSGVRLNLADLVENLPDGQDLRVITDMNNRGNMIGRSSTGNHFLLERVGVGNQ